jgi:hypothetical protein
MAIEITSAVKAQIQTATAGSQSGELLRGGNWQVAQATTIQTATKSQSETEA